MLAEVATPVGRVVRHASGSSAARSQRESHGRVESAVAEGPWRSADLVPLASFLGLGLLGLVVASIGTRGATVFTEQQAWSAAAAASLVLSLVGVCVWLNAGVRRIRDLEQETLELLRELVAVGGDEGPVDHGPILVLEPTALRGASVCAGSGMTRYHVATCILASGKDLDVLTVTEAASRGLRPCAVCIA